MTDPMVFYLDNHYDSSSFFLSSKNCFLLKFSEAYNDVYATTRCVVYNILYCYSLFFITIDI